MQNSVRDPILIKNTDFILKENPINPKGDIIWTVEELSTSNTFNVHCTNSAKLHIKFFRGHFVTPNTVISSLRTICKILVDRGQSPTIKIACKNQNLIRLCCCVGFRKDKKVKEQYILKKLKN